MIPRFSWTAKNNRSRSIGWVWSVLVFLLALFLAALAAAGDYALDYADIGVGGGQSQTTDYAVIDLLKVKGVDNQSQSSTDYTVTSTTGLKEETNVGVDDWLLY